MSASLESRAVSGGVVLVVRQLFGIILSLAGMLITTRLLGPHKYGQFAIVNGIIGYLANVGKMGLDVYLIRAGQLEERQVGVTQGLYLALGAACTVLILVMGPLVAWWCNDPFLRDLTWSYALITPLTLMSSVPLALLDRQLLYKKAAKTELAGQLVYVLLSLSLVWTTGSVWGVVGGIFGQTVTILLLASWWSGASFRPRLERSEVRAQLSYGAGYSASMWIWQARDLVNPLLVGKLLGAEATAFVAMAIRLATLVGFAKTAVWRVYMSYLARLSDDRPRMKEAIQTGLSHQLLVTGMSFLLFLSIGPDLVQWLMGSKWAPTFLVFPFIAAGVVVNSSFSLYSSALYIVGKNHDVSLFHVAHILLFAASVPLFAALSPSVAAYGWAEVAAFASYFLLRHVFRRRFFAMQEGLMWCNLLLLLGGIALATRLLSEPLWLRLGVIGTFAAVILLAVPRNRSQSATIVQLIRQKFAAGAA